MEKIILLAISCLVGGIIIGLSFNASAQESSSIPSWIKSTAKYWVNEDVSDADFIKALQWMVTNKIIVLPDSNTQQTTHSASSSGTNVLTSILPSIDVRSPWQSSPATSSTLFNILATPKPPPLGPRIPLTPNHTIEQIFTNNSDTPPSVIIVDIASFQVDGISNLERTNASIANEEMISYFKNQNGLKAHYEPYSPTPVDNSACSLFTLVKMKFAEFDMYCVKGNGIFVIKATGKDFSTLGEVKNITDEMLRKIVGYQY